MAKACEDLIADPVWKSALRGDRSENLAVTGKLTEALKLARECPNSHMAVLAFSRVMAKGGKDTCKERFGELMALAAGIKDTDQRDFALRIAAAKIAHAGFTAEAIHICEGIKQPASGFLALVPFVDDSTFEKLMTRLTLCTPGDQNALAEILVASCGKQGLTQRAMDTVRLVAPGWPRVRVLCDSARLLGNEKARPLILLAVGEIENIGDIGWRCVARSQIALTGNIISDHATVKSQCEMIFTELNKIINSDEKKAVIPQAIETLIQCKQQGQAGIFLREILRQKPEPGLRDVLVPLLVDAGLADEAVREWEKNPLENDYARRFLLYRLARAGRMDDAIGIANTLNIRTRSESLCEIARAQIPDAIPNEGFSAHVGLSLHGGWFYWPNRLERAGISWDVMPFCTPYEEGAKGLSLRYKLLGYPGAGDHLIQCSPVGNEQVRSFLREGGGLFGICAGQLFATGHPNGHRFVPADYYYLRGNGPHQVQITENHPAGTALPGVVIINRQNGDFLIPKPGCDVIGWYDNQKICAAVVASRYGMGRVVVSSPHPEGDNSYSPTDRLCIEITRWILEGTCPQKAGKP